MPMVCEFHRTTGRKVDGNCPPIETMSAAELSAYVEANMPIERHYEVSASEQVVEATRQRGLAKPMDLLATRRDCRITRSSSWR